MRYPPAQSPDPEAADMSIVKQPPVASSSATRVFQHPTEASLCQAETSLVDPRLWKGLLALRQLIASAESSRAAYCSGNAKNGSHENVWDKLFSGGEDEVSNMFSPDLDNTEPINSGARKMSTAEAHRIGNQQKSGCEGHRDELETRPEQMLIRRSSVSSNEEVAVIGKPRITSNSSGPFGEKESNCGTTCEESGSDGGAAVAVVDHTSKDGGRCPQNAGASIEGDQKTPHYDDGILKMGDTARREVPSESRTDLGEAATAVPPQAAEAGTPEMQGDGRENTGSHRECSCALEVAVCTAEGAHVAPAAVLEAGAREGRRLASIAVDMQKALTEQRSTLLR